MGGGADNGGGAASALLKVQLNSSFFLTFNDYQFLTVETLALSIFERNAATTEHRKCPAVRHSDNGA